ncbi:MAG: right-handed parallel beta-helix repeat-containing protein [Promethearchaeota archaeon]
MGTMKMLRPHHATGILTTTVLILSLFAGIRNQPPIHHELHSSHVENFGLVYLWSESEFLAFPNKTGAGTEGDPYIIRDLYIEAMGSNDEAFVMLFIKSFHVHLINITINATSITGGILLQDCANISVINCTVTASGIGGEAYYGGIAVLRGRNCTVENNTVEIIGGSTIDDYLVERCKSIAVMMGNDNFIYNNTIISGRSSSIYIFMNSTSTVLIKNNTLLGQGSFFQFSNWNFTIGTTLNSTSVDSSNTVNGKPYWFFRDLDSVNLSGPQLAGQITYYNCSNVNISSASGTHVELAWCNETTITNTSCMIRATLCNNISISGSNISAPGADTCIWFDICNNGTINATTVTGSLLHGIRLSDCVNFTINQSTCTTNGCGIGIIESVFILIRNCSITGNGFHGLYLFDGDYTFIDNCSITSNRLDGIWLAESNMGNVTENTIAHNEGFGVRSTDAASHNVWFFYNAFINNTLGHAIEENSSNQQWHDWTNGNYWDDFELYHVSPTNDGINWDQVYYANGIRDEHALVTPFLYDIFPIANFSENNISTSILQQDTLSFTFTGECGNGGEDNATITWDFGDGTIISGTISNATTVEHQYLQDGIFTVKCSISDLDGDIKTKTVLNLVEVIDLLPSISLAVNQSFVFQGDTLECNIAGDLGDEATTIAWDFGDGATFNDTSFTNHTHVFLVNGTFTITVTITDWDLDVATSSVEILVLDPDGDPDGDGLTTRDEIETYRTNYTSADTDGDGFDDGWEVLHGFDPTNSSDFPAAAPWYAEPWFLLVITISSSTIAIGSAIVHFRKSNQEKFDMNLGDRA